ncbi:hypothetical protein QQ045_004237 [Rhodiola kirilowii]
MIMDLMMCQLSKRGLVIRFLDSIGVCKVSNGTGNLSVEMEGSLEVSDVLKENGSRKRVRSDSCTAPIPAAFAPKLLLHLLLKARPM